MATDFINSNSPTSYTVRALWYLNNFFSQQAWTNGLSYEYELRALNLDYSLGSLKRIDDLLSEIRLRGNLQEQIFFEADRNQKFVFLLTFYCGELVGRIRGQAPVWYDFNEFVAKYPQMADKISPSFAHYILVQHPKNETYAKDKVWFPLVAIYDRLFHKDENKSVYQSIRTLLDQHQYIPDEQCFSTPCVQSLDIDIQQEIEKLPATALGYLQQVPSELLLNQHPVYQNVEQLHQLYQHGKCVWGVSVRPIDFYQNERMPIVDMVYDPTGRTDIEALREIAQKIYTLYREENVEPENQSFAQYLLQAMGRLQAVDIPVTISVIPLKISSIYVWRPHLPSSDLSLDALPILIDSQTDAKYAMILPAYFWRGTEYYQQYVEHSVLNINYGLATFKTLLEQPELWQNQFGALLRPTREQMLNIGKQYTQLVLAFPNDREQAQVNQILQQFYQYLVQHKPKTIPKVTSVEVVPTLSAVEKIVSTDQPLSDMERVQQYDFSSVLAELIDPQLCQAVGVQALPQIDKAVQHTGLAVEQVNKLLDVLLKGTQQGNSACMLYLAYLYLKGQYVEPSLEQANDLILGAINANDWRGYSFKTEVLKALNAEPEVIIAQYEQAVEAGHPTIHQKISQFAIQLAKKGSEMPVMMDTSSDSMAHQQVQQQMVQSQPSQTPVPTVQQFSANAQFATLSAPAPQEPEPIVKVVTNPDEMTEEQRMQLYEMMREQKAQWQNSIPKSKIDFSSPIVKGVAIAIAIILLLIVLFL
ncbi:hypothetical protein [Moraxella sp. ZY210820]|uniref:hypothetical protein n=1 Tax=unclassified Moraxella TaxID=2685852 RepID=UPI0027316E4F|nr:hypothetical protein [Moraxella sp. ZY210820]WLF83142.1 hypothetical protein LU301_07635 [Moraxella sp. ZY210820]